MINTFTLESYYHYRKHEKNNYRYYALSIRAGFPDGPLVGFYKSRLPRPTLSSENVILS